MTKEEPERIKQGYQPSPSKNAGVIPPNTGSHVRMKENEYTWKDLDKAWWEGFDNAKNKMEKRIADLEKENAELKAKLKPENCLKLLAKGGYVKFTNDKLTKAKEFLNKFMRISKAIDEDFDHDYSELIGETDQFLKEVEE